MKIFQKYILRMFLCSGFLVLLSMYFFEKIQSFFYTNVTLNSTIVFILILGIILLFRQVFILQPEIDWLNSFVNKRSNLSIKSPNLLKPISQLIKKKPEKIIFSQIGAKTILESIESRLIEQREISRYLIGLLIFLGLLGTFWGLLETIQSVSLTIKSLDFSSESQKLFLLLKEGLEKPLSGMGTAFSSSLFGLGGSLILGFYDLQAGQAQNRFYNEVEEKLANYTKISSVSTENIKTDFAPSYIESLIENTTENLKMTTKEIEKQNVNQQNIVKSLIEINHFLDQNISTNKEIKEELKVLSKTISNTLKKN